MQGVCANGRFRPATCRLHFGRKAHTRASPVLSQRHVTAHAKSRLKLYEIDIHSAIDLTVIQEHQEIDKYITDYLNPEATADDQQNAVWLLIKALSMHLVKKEMVMYPAVRTHLGDQLADKGLGFHKRIKERLVEFDEIAADSPGFRSKFDSFVTDLRAQFKQESDTILPALRRSPALDLKQLEQLGINFAWASYVAPGRPHLDLPQRPPFDEALFKAAKDDDVKRDLQRYNVLQY